MDKHDVPAPQILRGFYSTWREQRRWLLPALACVLIETLLVSVAVPLILSQILTAILAAKTTLHVWAHFRELLALFMLVSLSSVVLNRAAGYLMWQGVIFGSVRLVRGGLDHLLDLSYDWHTSTPSGATVSALRSYESAYDNVANEFAWRLFPTIIRICASIVVLLWLAWPIGLATAVLTGVVGWVSYRGARRAGGHFVEMFSAWNTLIGVVSDALTNLPAVLSMGGRVGEGVRLGRFGEAVLSSSLVANRRMLWERAKIEVSTGLTIAAVLTIAVWSVANKVSNPATIFLLLNFGVLSLTAAWGSLFDSIRTLAEQIANATAFAKIAQTPPQITDAPEATILTAHAGAIQGQEVVFGYRSAPLFNGLSFSIRPGEHVGLVGPSGGGKSTLVKLLMRFYDVQGGAILIDGQDIGQTTQESVRRTIAYVPQDPSMFHRTLGENLWYGQEGPVDMERVVAAAKAAHVHEFAQRLPEGYDTLIGERGSHLSGGQRQRVAIAQAILKRAPVLVLDEATSALDSESEALVQDALWRLMEGTTALVVAHRLSTLVHMDRILVLEHGQVVQSGSHAELLAQGGLYARLWQHQSGGFIVDEENGGPAESSSPKSGHPADFAAI